LLTPQANNETLCYRKFEDMMESHGTEDQIEDDAWDVLNEMAHLRIIKDIRDELHMIKRVISEQEDVVQTLYGKPEKRKSSPNSKVTAQEEMQLLESMQLRLRKVDKLEREALMVEQRVSTVQGTPEAEGVVQEPADGRSSRTCWISSRSRAT
jgi:Mg2+ and Co2+ transporter CorA